MNTDLLIAKVDNLILAKKEENPSHSGVSSDTSFNGKTFLENIGDKLSGWIGILIFIIGCVALFFAIWRTFSAFRQNSKGGGQTQWGMIIGLYILGGVCIAAGGWGLIARVSSGAYDTIQTVGN